MSADIPELLAVLDMWRPTNGIITEAATAIRELQAQLDTSRQATLWEITLHKDTKTQLEEADGVDGRCSVGHHKKFTYRLDGKNGCVVCELNAATNPLGCIHSTFTPNCLGCAKRGLLRTRELLEAANKSADARIRVAT